jgi:DDE superfamily endonuclease
MDDKELLDLYSDYLISAFGQTTGTGMAELLGNQISHDRIQRFLSKREFTSADLGQVVKPHVRALQREDGGLIIDDSLAEKPYTDENEIICCHDDHAHDRQVKGINFLTALYHARAQSLPVGFRLVAKTEYYLDKKDGKTKRRSPISKNAPYQALVRQAQANQIPFQYVLNDVWYASADNMNFIKEGVHLDFIMPLKANRKVALSQEDKAQGRYGRVDQVTLESGVERIVYLESVACPLALVKQVLVNEDDSLGLHYLVSSDLSLTGESIMALYRKRWNVEPFYKSLKQKASLEKSPTQTVRTQTNPLFASFCAYIKLELLTQSTRLNHFALKSRLYLFALHSASDQLRQLQPVRLPA